MSTAEKILAPHLTEINYPLVDRHKKFFRHSEAPGKLVREVEGQPVRVIKNEVRAMSGLVQEFEDRYGIATAKPKYVIGPDDKSGEATAVIICDEVPHEETAEQLIFSGKYAEPLDELNLKFIQHAQDLFAEGGDRGRIRNIFLLGNRRHGQMLTHQPDDQRCIFGVHTMSCTKSFRVDHAQFGVVATASFGDVVE